MPLSKEMEYVMSISSRLTAITMEFVSLFEYCTFAGIIIMESRNHEYQGVVSDGIKITATIRNDISPHVPPITIYMTISKESVQTDINVIDEWQELFDTIIADPDAFTFW